ncbi:MAG: TerB family tellurite resistance protein [Flavobacteriales bacterium]|jgi:uncharacterized tellurite resistance protein B-like protein|nr:TerB family tellurite resistance protein [Flavobacteriales bacterium]
MSIAQIFESGERTQDKGHFKNLVLIANADGVVTEEETKLLNRIGKNIGLNEEQINAIKENPSQFAVIPPVSKVERLEQMVQLIKMMKADGSIDQHEYSLLELLAVRLGFNSLDDVDVKKAIELLAAGEDVESIAEAIA